MCGIVGVFAKRGEISPERVGKAVELLDHRGPDSRRVWVGGNSQIALGHARLSIIDLVTGDQPLVDEEERIHAVVNGELYGFQKIRADLESKGHRFKTKSDSEILIHLYKEYGTACLSHLRGEFAFILWDQNNQTLFAGRDRFGIKPLYYHSNEDQILFSSEMKSLAPLGVQFEWDEEMVYQLHSSFLTFPSRTCFKNVFQVPPGHFLLATRGQEQVIKYWDFDYPTASDLQQFAMNENEATVELRRLFHESVKLRLHADVPVACYLSGGLDSCAVLGTAALYTQSPIAAFTLSFDQAEYDEREIAREMAEKSGSQFTPIPIHPGDLADHFESAVWQGEVPLFNTHAIAKFMLSRAVRDAGYKVVLTGEGSDEIFAGYPHFRRDMILYNSENQDPEQVKALLKSLSEANQVSQGILLASEQLEPIQSVVHSLGRVPSFFESNSSIGSKMLSFLRPDFLSARAHTEPFRNLLNRMDLAGQLIGRDSVNQSLYLWSKTMLPNYILTVLGDRMEMAHSIEGRVPFLDHHLVEFVTRLPVNYKIRAMTEKYLLREAAKPVITETVYQRQKHPFLAPPATRKSNSTLMTLIQDTLRSENFRKIPYYDHKRIGDLLENLPKMSEMERERLDPALTFLTSVAILNKKFCSLPS